MGRERADEKRGSGVGRWWRSAVRAMVDPRRPPNVAMMQATDFGNLDDPAELRRRDGASIGCIFVEREVGSRPVIVREVCVQRRQTCSVWGSPTGATARRP